MSRKKNLSPTASLATCLDFAARVLSSTSTVQEVCTKPVLAPMVVEAHRYGQQAMKHLEPGAPTDVRKLLRILQGKQYNKLLQGSPLAKLDIADLSWDFEGTVVDTLEMELEELENRAAKTTNNCVVFSAASHLPGSGQAVIWFPHKNYEDLRDEDARKKRQILLYVCPGRVKVVKSVGDLIKKMCDELPALREKGARYNVWAVVMGSKSSNQQEKQASALDLEQPHDDDSNQCPTESVLKTSSSPINIARVAPGFETSAQQRTKCLSTESKRSRTSESNQDAVDNLPKSVKEHVDLVSEPQDNAFDQAKLPPVTPRLSSNHEATAKSIFSFGVPQKASMELRKRLSERVSKALAGVERDEKDDEIASVGNVAEDASMRSAEDNTDFSGYTQHQISRSKRAIVSASLAELSTASKQLRVEKEIGLGLGVCLQHGFAWQSCDGKVLRRSVRPQHLTSNTDSELKKTNFLANSESSEDSGDKVDTGNEGQNTTSDYAVDEVDGNVHNEDREKVRDDHDEVNAEGDKEVQEKVSRSSDMLIPQCESRDQFPHQTLSKVAKSADDNLAPSPVIITFGKEPTGSSNQAEDQTQTSVDSPQSLVETPRISTSVEVPSKAAIIDDSEHFGDENNNSSMIGSLQTNFVDPDKEEDSVVCTTEVDSTGRSDSPTESVKILPSQKPKPAAVNYKDKLGARVWWELEYTARRLEREEMMEHQQRARHWQLNNQVKQGQRPTGEHLPISQQMEPTGSSKKDQPTKQREASIVSSKSVIGERQVHGELCTLARAQKQANRVELPAPSSLTTKKELLDIEPTQSYSHQSSGNTEMKASPCETMSPSRIQNSLRGSKVIEMIKNVEVSPLSRQSSRSEKDRDIASISNTCGDHELKGNSVDGPNTPGQPSPSLCTPSKSHEHVSDRWYERRQLLKASISKSTVRAESVKSSFVQPQDPIGPDITESSNQDEDEDEVSAQIMWGSTHTSYERDPNTRIHTAFKEDELEMTEVASAVPFRIHGRVPIRTRSRPATDGPSSSNSTEHSPSSHFSPRNIPSEPPARRKPSEASTGLQTSPAIPTAATFIGLGEDNTTDYATASAKTRQDRLNELRQKKLQKLQQTRDMSRQQQKEKQQQRQVQRPISINNSVYSKKASNRQLMQNALEFTLLAGGSMEKERTLALQALAESTCDNFIVLLKSEKEMKFRALYENRVDRDSATRIFSVLPSNSARAPLKLGSSDLISQFFKYSSAKKQFLPVPTRSFTVKTDACALVDQLLFKGKSKTSTSALARLL